VNRLENLLLTSVGGEKRNNVMLVELDKEDIEAATQWCSKIAGQSLRKEYIKIDAANRALVRAIAQLRLLYSEFVRRRNASRTPQLVDPRIAKVVVILNAPWLTPEDRAVEILAVIDEVK
jgi:NRPS condensation-like uncharacterized protein